MRTTHLGPEEIAAEALRLFDEGGDPSIRQLALALKVTPSAIYHHFDSRAEIIQSAVGLVWAEVLSRTNEAVGNPFEADPIELLSTIGLFARRGFLSHYKITPYMAAIPRSDELAAVGVAIFANAFERLGIHGRAAGDAFHYYASYCFGNALYSASRLIADDALGPDHPGHETLEEFRRDAGITGTSEVETRAAIDEILDLSELDPERDEKLFVAGVRQILEGFARV